MKIKNLILTQEYIRSITKVLHVQSYLAQGNDLSKCPIKLIEVPGYGIYLHDGLTRALGCYFSGREILKENEYQIKKLEIDDYCAFAPENGWYTPFDPSISVRTFQFMYYKELIVKQYQQSRDNSVWTGYVKRYSRPREITNISQII